MELTQALHDRHSIRAFQNRPVDEDVLKQLFEAASLAPSSLNSQPWHYHVARGAARAKVTEIMGLTTVHLNEYIDVLGEEAIEHAKQFYADLGEAPVVMGVSVPKAEDELTRINIYLSAGASVENMLLKAVEFGLGACNVTYSFWVREQLSEAMGVPEDREIISLVLLGYPAEEPHSPSHDPDCYTLLD